MKKYFLFVIPAFLLLAVGCNLFSQPNDMPNSQDDFKNLVSFLQANKLNAAIVQNFTTSHESSIVLVRSDGTTQTLDKWTDNGDRSDMDYPGTLPMLRS